MAFSPYIILIMGEFHVTYVEAGFLTSAYFYSYVVMQFTAGHLGDRFGRKRILEIGCFMMALIALLMGFSNTFMLLFVLFFGFTQGFYFGNDRSIISYYTPKEKMGIGQALGFVGAGLGFAAGTILGGFLAQIFGWRYALSFMAAPLFMSATLIWKFIKEPPIQGGRSGCKGKRIYYWEIFKHRDLWLIYFANFFAMYPFWTISTWAPKTFLEVGVPELATASIFSSLFGLSSIPGLLIVGSLLDKMVERRVGRKVIGSISLIFIALFTALIGFGFQNQSSVWVLALFVFIGGMFNWGVFATFYAIIAEICPPEIYGTTFGFFNAIGFLSSIIAPIVAGWLKDITGSFTYGFYIAAIMATLGCIIMVMFRTVYKLRIEKPLNFRSNFTQYNVGARS
jgi:MFS family permease